MFLLYRFHNLVRILLLITMFHYTKIWYSRITAKKKKKIIFKFATASPCPLLSYMTFSYRLWHTLSYLYRKLHFGKHPFTRWPSGITKSQPLSSHILILFVFFTVLWAKSCSFMMEFLWAPLQISPSALQDVFAQD